MKILGGFFLQEKTARKTSGVKSTIPYPPGHSQALPEHFGARELASSRNQIADSKKGKQYTVGRLCDPSHSLVSRPS
jgi:hypothetical protein